MSDTISVLRRYAGAAITVERELCCPVTLDPALLEILPREIVECDYGCGDPSRFVRPGDVVLDLGSGSGKACYVAAQLTGPTGAVIGVDANDAMLALARKHQACIAATLGGDRVRFAKGLIQDLALDLEELDRYLAAHPIRSSADLMAAEAWKAERRRTSPMIPDSSVDLVVSNCVVNLVAESDRGHFIREVARVLRPGGRVAISDIVSDEPVPADLKGDPTLWSDCIAGAFLESDLVKAFADAGFIAVRIESWQAAPWRVVSGIEFRSVTLTAVKSHGSDCIDRGHAVIYRGPYAEIRDEEGHVFPRGERIAVCERTFKTLTEGACKDDFIGIAPVRPLEPRNWCAPPGTRRAAAETKLGYHASTSCSGSGCC